MLDENFINLAFNKEKSEYLRRLEEDFSFLINKYFGIKTERGKRYYGRIETVKPSESYDSIHKTYIRRLVIHYYRDENSEEREVIFAIESGIITNSKGPKKILIYGDDENEIKLLLECSDV